MATVNFLYRSTREKAPLNLRLLFRHDGNDYVIGGRTKEVVTKDYWNQYHDRQRIKDIEIKNFQVEVTKHLNGLENHILDHFRKTNPAQVNKKWLKDIVDEYYNPDTLDKSIPTVLVSYIDYYLDYRKNEITTSNVKKVTTLKNKLVRFENEAGRRLLITDINEDFKKDYVSFSEDHQYSQNTQQRELVLIKTICFHARHMGLKTHHQLDGLKLQRENVKHIYLTPEEIEKLEELELEHDYLKNARDWLLISYYTGQRVSDFMRFKPSMIREEHGKYFLEFRQKKTKKLMSIPFSSKARAVCTKHNGNFPRPISSQKYNDYIKKVCEEAKFNNEVKGKKRICIAPEGVKPKATDYRDVEKTYKKWELVSSHIGRRSFATNYYGKVPTTLLMNITGHGSEKMFLNYIKKSNKDLAVEAYKYFE